jgi:polyhydroxybutyrate depolymerase
VGRLTRAASVALVTLALLATACAGDDNDVTVSSTKTSYTLVDAGTTTTAAKPADVPAAASSGCGTPSAKVAAGETRVDTTSGGAPRWYLRHIPPKYDGTKPVPVVIDIHGYAEGAVVHTKMSALGPFGDTHDFVTISPQGSGTAVALWNTDLGSADVKYIGDLLDEVGRTLCVDTNRIFVTGLSNGAFMTSAVACAYADRIAAAAPVAGIRDIDGCAPKRAVPVVAFHGTADPFVSYDGGLGAKALALPAPDGSGKTLGQSGAASTQNKGPTIPEITAAWAKRNDCASTAPAQDAVASDVTLLQWSCPPGADVELYRVTGGGHSWPGSTFSKAIESVVGPTTMSIDANEIMWKFFEQHPLR